MEREKAIESLELFVEKADKLETLSYASVIRREGAGYRCKMKDDIPIAFTRRGPNDESVDAFLLTFRFFVQNRECSSLSNVECAFESLAGVYRRALFEKFKEKRSLLNAYLDRPCGFMNAGLTNRGILNTFLYGSLAHANNPEKRARYLEWASDDFVLEHARWLFMVILAQMLKRILFLRGLAVILLHQTGVRTGAYSVTLEGW